jgi:hypothetical protein
MKKKILANVKIDSHDEDIDNKNDDNEWKIADDKCDWASHNELP